MLTALQAADFGAILKTWRKWTGASQTKTSALVGLAQSDVSAIENGHRLVTTAAVQVRILDGLDVPIGVRPLTLGPAPIPTLGQAPDDDEVNRLRSATAHDRLDRSVLDYLKRALAEHRRIEDQLGSKVMLPIVAAQMSVLERMIRFAPADLHDEALRLLSQYSQFMAWMHHDQRDDKAALASYANGESQAQEAGDPTMAAGILSMKAHLAWSNGNPMGTVRYAKAAQWAHQILTPGAYGMAAQMEARGLAMFKDADGADRAVERAQDLLARAAEHPEDEPPWLYFYDDIWMRLQVGALNLTLGRAGRAVELLTGALDDLDAIYVRDGAWYRAILARALLEAGDAEASAAAALRALPDALETNRLGFTIDHVRETTKQLQQRAGSLEPVRELVEQVRGV